MWKMTKRQYINQYSMEDSQVENPVIGAGGKVLILLSVAFDSRPSANKVGGSFSAS